MRIPILAASFILHAAGGQDVPEVRAQARAALDAGQPTEAVSLLRVGVEAHPEAAVLHADLGSAQLATGDFAGAAQAFSRSLELEPAQPVVRYNLAYALRESGAGPKAIEAYRAYLTENASDADAWYGLAQTYERQEDWGGAAEAYERYGATEKRPEQQQWVAKALARATELRGRTAPPPLEASAATPEGAPPSSASPSPSPDSNPVAPSSGVTAADDTEETSTPEAAPTSPRIEAGARGAPFAEGLNALRSGRYAEALRSLETLPVEVRESDYAVIAARAGAHLGLYEGRKASKLYTRALGVAPDTATASLLLGLAEAQRINGDTSQARASLERLLALPDAPASVKSIAKARRAEL